MKLRNIVQMSILLVTHFSWGQNFKLMRYDEDYSGWKDSTKTFYNRIKYLPLSQNGNSYLSLGGEARGEFDYAHNEDWGQRNVGKDVFFLQRYHLHADWLLGKRVRVFGELRSGLEDGRKNGPRSIDEDKLNMQNLFVDIVPYQKLEKSLALRVGRQELRYGSGRLIDVRDGPNLRLYFDGVKVAYTSATLKVDAFVMADSRVNTGVFDNRSTRKANLWGIYNTYLTPGKGSLDFYYLGINRANARFDVGVANESRHTIGTRISKKRDGFVQNFEAGYQFGRFGSDYISAWAISSEVSYVFEGTKGLPTIKLRSDYISGDKTEGDGKLGTFNAMYPNGGYFGMNPQAGPANLISIHPDLAWNPGKNKIVTFGMVYNRRYSANDGVYSPTGTLKMPSFDSGKKYIGTTFMTTFSWHLNDFLNYNIGMQYFKTGGFINEVIPQHKDGFFVGSVLGFKF